jgi:redox-sensitive bicupin YhaK (pirin superfamily)
MVYILSGAATVAAGTTKMALHEGEAVGVRIEKSDESLVLTPESYVHLLPLSGEDPNEPVVSYGPFIMNTEEEIAEAFDRYRAGKMGRLEAVHVSA